MHERGEWGAFAGERAKRAAGDQFHDDEPTCFCLACVVDGHDIWMTERRDCTHLPFEAPHVFWFIEELRGQQLQRNLALEASVFRKVDSSRSTSPQHRQQLIPPEAPPHKRLRLCERGYAVRSLPRRSAEEAACLLMTGNQHFDFAQKRMIVAACLLEKGSAL